MRPARLCLFASGLFALLMAVGGTAAQDKKDDAPPAGFKGQLPMNWSKLGLTDEQKDQVYKVQAKYNADIDKLEAQIKELKEKLSKERLDILTADQKKRYKEILEKKTGN